MNADSNTWLCSTVFIWQYCHTAIPQITFSHIFRFSISHLKTSPTITPQAVSWQTTESGNLLLIPRRPNLLWASRLSCEKNFESRTSPPFGTNHMKAFGMVQLPQSAVTLLNLSALGQAPESPPSKNRRQIARWQILTDIDSCLFYQLSPQYPELTSKLLEPLRKKSKRRRPWLMWS